MNPIYKMPGHLVRRLQQISVSIFADSMKRGGMDLTSPQYGALSFLDENPGVDQATLAGIMALDRPTMGGVIERLASKGFVKRTTCTVDRRAKRLELTPEGKAIIDVLSPLVNESQAQILDGLTESEKAEFIRLAEKLTQIHNDRSRAPLRLPKVKKDA